jgi:hypothetical protein
MMLSKQKVDNDLKHPKITTLNSIQHTKQETPINFKTFLVQSTMQDEPLKTNRHRFRNSSRTHQIPTHSIPEAGVILLVVFGTKEKRAALKKERFLLRFVDA